MSDTIPTAEHIANNYYDTMINHYGSISDLAEEFRKFAKLHVKAALEAASKSKNYSFKSKTIAQLNILSCYPEKLIK